MKLTFYHLHMYLFIFRMPILLLNRRVIYETCVRNRKQMCILKKLNLGSVDLWSFVLHNCAWFLHVYIYHAGLNKVLIDRTIMPLLIFLLKFLKATTGVFCCLDANHCAHSRISQLHRHRYLKKKNNNLVIFFWMQEMC